jgi:hypothetical protein
MPPPVPFVRATRPPRSRRPTLTLGLLASDTPPAATSSLDARAFAARCFLDLTPPAILAFGVFAISVVSPVTWHAKKYCNYGHAHRTYQAPPATSTITKRAHTVRKANAQP